MGELVESQTEEFGESEANSRLTKSISDWIDKNGVGLELKTASQINKKFKTLSWKLNLSHSRQYLDFDPDGRQKLRETDLVAQISKRINHNFYIHTWLVIECKNYSNPFVLYKNTEPLNLFSFQPLDDIWQVLNPSDLNLNNIHGSTNSGFLNSPDSHWCYAINSKIDDETKSPKTKNIALEGFWQVNSAVNGVIKQAVISPNIERELHLFVPLLVTSAPLFYIWLDEYDEIKFAETDRELLVSQPHHDSGKPLGTWVCNLEGLSRLLDDWKEFLDQLDYRNI
jgi:hypothetical protein